MITFDSPTPNSPRIDETYDHEPVATSPIGLEELRRKLALGNVVLLDALSALKYEDSHLPGALNVPGRLVRTVVPVVVPDRSTEIVVYGSNSRTEAAARLIRRVRKLGYRNVRWYRGGKQEWMRFLLQLA